MHELTSNVNSPQLLSADDNVRGLILMINPSELHSEDIVNTWFQLASSLSLVKFYQVSINSPTRIVSRGLTVNEYRGSFDHHSLLPWVLQMSTLLRNESLVPVKRHPCPLFVTYGSSFS